MKTLVRIGFLALIALGLASQTLRASRGEVTATPAEMLIGRLDRLHITTTPIPDSKLLLARSAECEKPYAVGRVRSDGGENETLQQLARPDIEVRYVYLGAVDGRPPAGQTVRWSWATLLFSAGLRSTRPPDDVMVVAFPRECKALEAVHWASLSP